MSTVSNLRATLEEPQRQQANNSNAARQGALSAVQHPRTLKRAETIAGSAAAAAARASAAGRPVLTAGQRQSQYIYNGPSTPTSPSFTPSGRLQAPVKPGLIRSPSTSNIAAVIAASRHNPPPPRPESVVLSGQARGLAVSQTDAEPRQEMPPPGAVEDVKKWLLTLNGTAISPTTSTMPQKPFAIISSPRESTMIHSPKPVRTITPVATLDPPSQLSATFPDNSPAPTPLILPLSSKPTPPPPRIQHANTQPILHKTSSPPKPAVLNGPSSTSAKPVPISRSPGPQATLHVPKRATTMAELQPHMQTPTSAPRNPEKPRSKNTSPQRPQTHVKSPEALADAMIASSLASWRAPSPSKPTPPPLPRRATEKAPHHHTAFLSHFKPHPGMSRTPSPQKRNASSTPNNPAAPTSVLRQTMRKELKKGQDETVYTAPPPSGAYAYESDPEPHHHKRGRARTALGLRKHPHKHHEGDRKRWRDAVTEAERKRYEGLWAANRGLHVPFSADERAAAVLVPSDFASGLVVRELWARSRLHASVLQEVWELVDGPESGRGRLSREEFVVGLWLIDQRLRGRKLPIRVADTLWRSVRGVYGLKVPNYK